MRALLPLAWRVAVLGMLLAERAHMALGKAVVAGVGAKMLTGSLLGFILVFALLYWLMGG